MNTIAQVLLMFPQGGGQEGGGSPYSSFIMLGLIIVVFYFFMIRPQVRKQKQLRQFREGLKVGDRIVTIGGIYGKVTGIQDTALIIEIADGVKIKVDKAAVNQDATGVMQQK